MEQVIYIYPPKSSVLVNWDQNSDGVLVGSALSVLFDQAIIYLSKCFVLLVTNVVIKDWNSVDNWRRYQGFSFYWWLHWVGNDGWFSGTLLFWFSFFLEKQFFEIRCFFRDDFFCFIYFFDHVIVEFGKQGQVFLFLFFEIPFLVSSLLWTDINICIFFDSSFSFDIIEVGWVVMLEYEFVLQLFTVQLPVVLHL